MPCSPGDNNLNPNLLPPYPPIPGFGIPFAPAQIPFPDITIPEGIPEDLIELMRKFLTVFPLWQVVPNLDNFAKDILDALISILNQLSPFLGFYRFIQALLNMIICIMDVLCAHNNPFSVIRAIRRLFKKCLPDFLNLFPWMALIAMILALILLIIALIEYLIRMIIAYIEQIIKNIKLLAEAIRLDDQDSVLAASRKIAYLLCLIEQLFAILIAFQAIMAIIQSLGELGGRRPCSSGNGSGCCDDDVCPPFIRNNPDGILGTKGRLIYQKALYNDTPGLTLPPYRNESWQLIDQETGREYNFSDIITPIDGNIYWPDGFTFDSNTSLKKAPYTLDLKLTLNPADFGHPDTLGARPFTIKNCIVTHKPTKNISNYNNSTSSNPTGTLRLEGGLVYEADGSPYFVLGQHANLNSFIRQGSYSGTLPLTDDSVYISDIEYTWNINHAPLVEYSLITIGCVPEISVESEIAALSINVSVLDRITLPDIGKTTACMQDALEKLREDVSEDNLLEFQSIVTGCLEELKTDSLKTYFDAFLAGVSIYTSEFTLVPEIQFVGKYIRVKVVLKDAGGTTLSFRIPPEVQAQIAALLEARVTLGTVGPFEYNGTDGFEADLGSTVAGTGEMRMLFNGEMFKEIINRDNDDPTLIIDRVATYQFVGMPAAIDDPLDRRDDGDVSRD